MSDEMTMRERRAIPVDRAERARPRRAVEVLEAAAIEDDPSLAEPQPAVEIFDPADHNIEDVLRYVDEHEGVAAAVAELERSGKARTTLLAQLDERIAAAEANAEANDDADKAEGNEN